jgi:hypothetical protein
VTRRDLVYFAKEWHCHYSRIYKKWVYDIELILESHSSFVPELILVSVDPEDTILYSMFQKKLSYE